MQALLDALNHPLVLLAIVGAIVNVWAASQTQTAHGPLTWQDYAALVVGWPMLFAGIAVFLAPALAEFLVTTGDVPASVRTAGPTTTAIVVGLPATAFGAGLIAWGSILSRRARRADVPSR